MVENALRIHVHDDTRVLDGMFRLVEVAKQQRPLDDTLSVMCGLIAQIAGVDVVSVYLRERHADREVLVMRGNVGFPANAVGRVQLGLDEGLTGVVAQRRRPVSVAIAQQDNRYKHVDGIGEEQYAAYLGVPLLVRGELAGVLVVQRRQPGTFVEADVALASSVAAPLIFAIEKHDGGGAHTWFVGTPFGPGRVEARAIVLPPMQAAPPSETAALHALEFDLVTAAQRLGNGRSPATRALDNLALVAIALRDHVVAPKGDVLARLQRAPYRSSSPASSDLTDVVEERRSEVTELWSFLVADMQHRLPICGSVLVVPTLGAFVALEAVARGAAAIAVAGTASAGARDVVTIAQVPTVVGIPNLLTNVRSGDLLEVDGACGTLRVGG